MVSIGILLFLAGFATQALRQAMVLNQQIGAREAHTTTTLALLRRDLQQAFLTQQLAAANTYRTVFVATEDGELFFATRANKRMYRDGRESDQAEITVWLEDMPDSTPGNVLYVRRAPQIDEEPAEGGAVYPVAYNVESLTLRLLDPRNAEWRTEWDSRSADYAGTLPRGVEFALVTWVPDPKAPGEYQKQAQKMTVLLEFADPVVRGAVGDNTW